MSYEKKIKRVNKSHKKSGSFLIAGGAVVFVLCFLIMYVLGAFGKKNDENDVSSVFTDLETSSAENIGVIVPANSSSQIQQASTSSKLSSSSPSSAQSSSAVASSAVTSSSVSISSEPAEIQKAYVPNGDWRLVVANKQHPLPESYEVKTAYVSGNYRLDSRIADAYKSMISAAKKDGITLVIISGFRTYQGQTNLYNNKVNKYINQGYSREKARELAAMYVAPPGTSEHLTGLAVDLISTNWYSYNSDLNSGFEKTEEFKWLYSHCAEYGFVLRYPKDKEDITGYSYEPWHYRYVGVDAAKEIMSRKICLEEYVEAFE